jgi:hypothetical protein
MKHITDIRRGLSSIPGALSEVPPENGYAGPQPGVAVTTIHESHDPRLRLDAFANSSDDSQEDYEAIPDFTPLFEIGSEVDESFPALGGEEGERIRKSLLVRGMDALGGYLTFHMVGAQWGIYINVSGIAYLVKYAFSELTAPLEEKANLAFHAILAHELFHFATDFAISQAELVHQEAWWLPAQKVFKLEKPGYLAEEERLANAYMLAAFRSMKASLRIAKKQEALRQFTRTLQPEGYCDGWKVRKEHWETLLAELAAEYGRHTTKAAKNSGLWDAKYGYDWAAQFPIKPKIDWRYCPIHLVHDGSRLGIPPEWLKFISRLASITESGKFYDKLLTLAQPIQKAWNNTKRKLIEAITPGADFKPWPKKGPGVFSVRVNDNFRAHLQRRRHEEIGWQSKLGLTRNWGMDKQDIL